MLKRKKFLLVRHVISVILGIAIIIGAKKYSDDVLAKKAEKKEQAKKPIPVRKVITQLISNKDIEHKIPVQGRTVAFNRMEISSEVTGVFRGSTRPFKPGTTFYKGDILMRVENNVLANSIQSQRSNLINLITRMMPDLKIDYPESFPQWDAYLKALDVSKSFPELPVSVNEREKSYVTGNGIYRTYIDIQTNEIQLGKYVVRAPFTGKITQGNLQPGTLIRQSQVVGELLNTGTYELAVPITLADLQSIKKGNKVQLKNNETNLSYTATVTRFGDQVDPTTQSITAYLSISGKDIKENMYLEGDIAVKPIKDAIELKQNAIVENKYVFEVANGVIKKIPVEIISKNRENYVVKGIPNGTQILPEVFTGAIDGMKVEAVSLKK